MCTNCKLCNASYLEIGRTNRTDNNKIKPLEKVNHFLPLLSSYVTFIYLNSKSAFAALFAATNLL